MLLARAALIIVAGHVRADGQLCQV